MATKELTGVRSRRDPYLEGLAKASRAELARVYAEADEAAQLRAEAMGLRAEVDRQRKLIHELRNRLAAHEVQARLRVMIARGHAEPPEGR